MNHCILLVEIMQPPQVRYTSDNVPVAEVIVQFQTPRDGEPPATLKMVAWNRMATEMEQSGYRVGDRLLVEGSVSMVTIDRQEGFREKHAELRAQRIHSLATLGAGGVPSAPAYGASTYAPAPQGYAQQPPAYPPSAPAAPPSNVAQFPNVNPNMNPNVSASPVNPPSIPAAPAPMPSVPPAPLVPPVQPASSPDFDDDDIPF